MITCVFLLLQLPEVGACNLTTIPYETPKPLQTISVFMFLCHPTAFVHIVFSCALKSAQLSSLQCPPLIFMLPLLL